LILVDSSVWIDAFRGVWTRHTEHLRDRLGRQIVVTGDLVLTEVLQGFAKPSDFETARTLMTSVPLVNICNPDLALQAARNHRLLRSKGLTVRKTIDTLIATRCIQDDLELLYSDRDFDGFVRHLGLRSALPLTS
jgi:predicted nucleic acid-binding protein